MTTSDGNDGATTFCIPAATLKLHTADDVQKYVDEINAMEIVTEFRFSGNSIGVEASEALAKALSAHKTIEKADLSDMFTGRLKTEVPISIGHFVECLIDQPNLKEIDLSDNAFGPVGAEPLVKLLVNNTSISTIILRNNGLGIGGGKYIADALMQIPVPSNLRTIIIGRNRLESQGAEYLSKAFELHKDLERVCMPQNSIRPEGIDTVLKSISGCSKLVELDLQDNTFTLVGSKACAKYLPGWPKLKVLNIGECLLGAEGCRLVVTALSDTHSSLQECLLSYNEMDVAGVKLIPAMLKGKTELTKLELNGNAFEAESAEVHAVMDVLRSLGKVDVLDELDDMELPSDEEDEDVEEAGSEHEDKEVDELTNLVKKL